MDNMDQYFSYLNAEQYQDVKNMSIDQILNELLIQHNFTKDHWKEYTEARNQMLTTIKDIFGPNGPTTYEEAIESNKIIADCYKRFDEGEMIYENGDIIGMKVNRKSVLLAIVEHKMREQYGIGATKQ